MPDYLEAICQSLGDVPSGSGFPTWRFTFTPYTHHWALPRLLYSFPLYEFADGQPLDPDGTSNDPYRFAVERSAPPAEQARIVASMTLGTLRRQSLLRNLSESGQPMLPELFGAIPEVDEATFLDGRLVGRLIEHGEFDAARSAFAKWGPGLEFRYAATPIATRRDVGSRVPFYARAYNGIPIIRESVDRLVGPFSRGQFASSSEQTRQLAEQWYASSGAAKFFAHAIRDALLAGVGVLDTSGAPPAFRLIRPGSAEITGTAPDFEIYEIVGAARERLPNAIRIPNDPSDNNPFGISLLEPLVPALRTYLLISEAIEATTGTVPEALINDQSTSAFLEALPVGLEQAENSLRLMLGQVLEELPALAPDAYFAGHEQWLRD